MPKRRTPLIDGEYYHIFNRTVSDRKLFYSQENYTFFLRLWKNIDFSKSIDLEAYCLMPNHFHFLTRIKNAESFTKKLSYLFNKYVKALNARRQTTGRLFGNRFKAKHIFDKRYLMAVCAYIHLNPLKAGLVSNLEDWPFSNYLEFVGKRNGTLWDEMFFQTYIQSAEDYEKYLFEKHSSDEIEPFIFDS